MRLRARVRAFSLIGALALFAGGCASDVHLTLRYPPRQAGRSQPAEIARVPASPQASAGSLILVPFADERKVGDKALVGRVLGGWLSLPVADIVADNSVRDWLTGAVAAELEKADFTVSVVKEKPTQSDVPTLTGEILFVGCWAVFRYAARVDFRVRLLRNGNPVFEKKYESIERSMTAWSNDPEKYARILGLALEKSARSLAADLRDLPAQASEVPK